MSVRVAGAARDLRRALARHRVLLSAGLAAASVATALTTLAPTPPATTTVVTVAHDVHGGAELVLEDLALVDVPVELAPTGGLTDLERAAGRVVVGPVRAGEALTDVRLLGAALLPPGPQVAVPVRVAEPATAALVRAGDLVDVLAAAPDGADSATTVVDGVRVLSVPQAATDTGEGALLVLAATRDAASRLAAAAVTARLSVVLHGR